VKLDASWQATPENAQRENAGAAIVTGLKWPLTLLGIVLVPPILFCLVFLPWLDEGHVPAIVLPMAYVFFVAPIVSPIGLWLSARAFKTYAASRRWTLLLIVIFIVGSVTSWALYLSGTVS
jgi:hypothetical protein